MQIFSPIQEISYNGFNISVKREDLIDPYISGNKWRKLKYPLADALANHKNHLVTFGGAYSNHLVATAAVASRNGLKATAFVRGENVANEMLLLCKLFGMQLIFVSRDSYKDKIKLFNDFFGNDEFAYFIDEGGASELGVKGCCEIIEETHSHFDHLFCAAGTGTTTAGLLKAINHHKLTTKLHVVPILKGGDFIKVEIEKYEANLSNLLLHTEYHFGGYAKTTDELLLFMKDFIAQTGILIDQVYTAKMFYAIYDLFKKGHFTKNEKILAIHTGGLLGIWGVQEKLNKILSNHVL
jgi:1-aminocyclopropane-1-carboxylate deaminase